ncbi:unnamed protein product [Cunninghamella blakesleeana]
MPPKNSSSQFTDQGDEIYDFLRKSNRPYSTSELSNHFQGRFTKGAIQKELDKLYEEKLLNAKTFGKAVIYTLIQDNYSEEEIQQLDKEIEELYVKLNTNQEKIKELQKSLKQVVLTPTTEQAKYQLEHTKKVNERMSHDLETWKKKPTVNISLPEQENINKEFAFYRKVWKDRKSLFYEILGTILENLPIKKDELLEEINFEDDPIPYNQDPLKM